MANDNNIQNERRSLLTCALLWILALNASMSTLVSAAGCDDDEDDDLALDFTGASLGGMNALFLLSWLLALFSICFACMNRYVMM